MKKLFWSWGRGRGREGGRPRNRIKSITFIKVRVVHIVWKMDDEWRTGRGRVGEGHGKAGEGREEGEREKGREEGKRSGCEGEGEGLKNKSRSYPWIGVNNIVIKSPLLNKFHHLECETLEPLNHMTIFC